MSEEIFDVVDVDDQVIGQQSRSEVHRLGLRHRAIHLLVFNASGELFLQKRSMKKDCFPGTWDSSVSGHVDAGETYDACALREPREEIGLELATVPQRLFKIGACEATAQEFVWVYRCEHEGPRRRLVRAKKNHQLDRRCPRGIRPRLRADLATSTR